MFEQLDYDEKEDGTALGTRSKPHILVKVSGGKPIARFS